MSSRVSHIDPNQETSSIKVPLHLKNEPLYKQIDLVNIIYVLLPPVLSIYGLVTTEVKLNTIILAWLCYCWQIIGITAGYHRLWSHKSYKATKVLEIILMLIGSAACQNSVRDWCKNHRTHHRYTDTDKDPHNIKRGFWFAHLGWQFMLDVKCSEIKVDDIEKNPILQWQHKYYGGIALFMCFIFPAIIAHLLWNDFRGGFFFAGATALFVSAQCTFLVNSLAHYPLLGTQPYDDVLSPVDSPIIALLTMGEGYHNFHHEFPNDYRNGFKWYHYDPTKWFILCMKYVGLAYDLNTFDENEIHKGETNMKQKKLDEEKAKIKYGIDVNVLPIWTKNECKLNMRNAEENGKIFIVENGIIYDVTEFVAGNKHPGGKSLIIQRKGKDVTQDFNGRIHNHSNAARNLMSHWRIAKLEQLDECIH